MHDSESPTTQKSMLRQVMQVHRAKAYANNSEAAWSLRDFFLQHIKLPPNSKIAGYHARASEMDPGPLLEDLNKRGHTLALPIVKGKGKPLQFRMYRPGDALQEGTMKILEPLASAPYLEPDIVIVPLLAFDRQGNRLGYGGGYYDRTLKFLRKKKSIVAIGVGYSSQEVSQVPTTPYDVKLDQIVTESGIIVIHEK